MTNSAIFATCCLGTKTESRRANGGGGRVRAPAFGGSETGGRDKAKGRRRSMRPVASDTPYKHIFIMDDGRAMIGGTRIKVEYIASRAETWGESPQEIQ